MNWNEITIYTTENAAEAISNFFHEHGADGVSIEESGTLERERDTSLGQWYELPLNDIPEGDAIISAYFAETTSIQPILDALKHFVEQLPEWGLDPGRATIHSQIVEEEAWATAWKQYYKPVKISDRITIKPTWEPYEAATGELILEMDPGMAFGTGTHATTALCIRTIEQVAPQDQYVIDVGTGSGILAIAAAKLGAKHVLAVDLDPVAVSSALENARLNGLTDQITVHKSDLLEILERRNDENLGIKLPVQLIVANILAEIILTFIDDVYDLLEVGGKFIASGIITAKQVEVEEALRRANFEIISTHSEEDWVAIIAEKRA